MTKNPLVNALSATLYIFLVTSVMNYASQFTQGTMNPVIGPVAFVSLITLSAAFMGSVFFLMPVQLYLNNKKKTGVNLFLHTLAYFAGITIIALILLFTGAFPFK